MSPSVTNNLVPFYYVMVVWGDEYVDMFLNISLPCFLSPGNLPAMGNLAESKFLILTTPQDRERITQSANFAQLQRLIDPVFVDSPWISEDIPYHFKAARGHRVAAEITAQHDGYCVYLCPDCLISDGSFKFLEQMARAGKQAVLTPGPRLVTETVYAELTDKGRLQPGQALTFSGRELVEFGLRHLHLEVQRYNWEHPYFAAYPQMCTWNVPGETGLLIRAFHLHPMLVSMRGAKNLSTLASATIDGDFLGSNITDWEQIHVEPDSDNLLIFSLTKAAERPAPMIRNTPDVAKLRSMAYSVIVNPLHRIYFTKAIKLHAGDLGKNWDTVEEETSRLTYSVLAVPSQTLISQKEVVSEMPLQILVSEVAKRAKRRATRTLHNLWPFGGS